MTEKDLIELIDTIKPQKCEKQYVEIKKALGGTTKKLYDTFSSFSNQSNGGTIVFGIEEKAGYEVTGVYDAQDLQVQVKNAAEQMEPVVRPYFTVAEYEGKVVVSAEIPECEPESKPCFYKPAGRLRGSYVRVGDADMPMTEYEIYSYEVYKKKIRDELRVVERASKNDFSRDKLNLFFAKLRDEKPQLANQTEQRILQLQGMTEHDAPTVAGLMLVGEYSCVPFLAGQKNPTTSGQRFCAQHLRPPPVAEEGSRGWRRGRKMSARGARNHFSGTARDGGRSCPARRAGAGIL